jgi:hypothetical protein
MNLLQQVGLHDLAFVLRTLLGLMIIGFLMFLLTLGPTGCAAFALKFHKTRGWGPHEVSEDLPHEEPESNLDNPTRKDAS